MTGHHRLKIEEPLTGERRRLSAHCEAVADRHDADLRSIQLVDQPHVGEDVRVTHVINGLAVLGRLGKSQKGRNRRLLNRRLFY